MRVFALAGIVLGLSVASTGAFAQSVSSGDNVPEEMKMLQPKHNLGCIAPASLSNKNTPPDLFAALPVCIRAGKYWEGAFLFAMAGVYGRYDTLRVEDKAAHRAVDVMRMQAIFDVSDERYDDFTKEGLNKILGEPKSLANVCKTLVKYGAPSYHPDYMLKFGETQTAGSQGKLRKNFKSKAAFESALISYLGCPKPL